MEKGDKKTLAQYRVILSNDDHNSLESVVESLFFVAGLPAEEAIQVALHTHKEGTGVVGSWHFELAETIMARLNNRGLTAVLEQVS